MAKLIGNLTKASFLFVLLIGLIFLYAQSFNPSGVFPQDAVDWNKILTGYLVIFALTLIGGLIFARDVIQKLATANYWKSFALKFIPVSIVSIVVLILIKTIVTGTQTLNFLSAISYISLPVLIFHVFVVTQIEEILFGGLIFTVVESKSGKLSANIITIILFSLFHYAKTGGNIAILLTYIPLRAVFNYVRNNGLPLLNRVSPTLFGATPQTQQANAGVHLAWNLFVIGIGR